jgi:preprotein translocase subunit SecE
LGEIILATKKKSVSTNTAETKITRISATNSNVSKPKKETSEKPSIIKAEKTAKRRNPFRAIADYFGGAWYELKQVHWPTRRATWSMTGALLGFTAFFVVVILVLDALFKYAFQLVLGQ